ncbi:YciI family protein [[Actinomadura] parvosata]|uniref:YciI family protein n=1 Tax=[Actinomadura] parvosata TaxID=1955412 RepID=UPI00406D0AD2
MKFLLNVYVSTAAGDVFDHERLLAVAGRSGELIGGHTLADPSVSTVVRVRDGVVEVSQGPYLPAVHHVAVQCLLDCDSRERAVELATLMAGDHARGIEVRPLMDLSGMEM